MSNQLHEEPKESAAAAFDRLLEIMTILRSENGCPWDREQTHHSLRSDTLEETYEFLEAVDLNDVTGMAEELGDLMILTALHAEIAREDEQFDMLGILNAVNAKLVRRHPHVFAGLEVESTEEVLSNWEKIKKNEPGYEDRRSVLDGVPTTFPALQTAFKLQKKAARVGFDWTEVEDVVSKVREELVETEQQLDRKDEDALEAEIGDLLFSVVNLSRFVGVDPENALRRTNRKFTRRFHRIEELLAETGESFDGKTLEELDALWDQAKDEESDG
ncbi:MAG: nucleoside triphosphate pyrophosphohydrolase [Candidatus Poribacteria bacterium]|nr:nucleoside triphosphate pyrophosphohydrolase [Candidatus Poribacteria bacterium]